MKRARHRFCCHRTALRVTLVSSAARTAKVRSIASAYSANVVVNLLHKVTQGSIAARKQVAVALCTTAAHVDQNAPLVVETRHRDALAQ